MHCLRKNTDKHIQEQAHGCGYLLMGISDIKARSPGLHSKNHSLVPGGTFKITVSKFKPIND